jgi:hypothetical protein
VAGRVHSGGAVAGAVAGRTRAAAMG